MKRVSGYFGVLFTTATLLSGCQTTDPYTGEQQVGNTAAYGGVGVVAGAIVGGLVGGESGAWKGAAIGGLAGAGYGNYIDQEEAVLRKRLQNTGVLVRRYGETLILVMPSHVTFSSSQADIQAKFYPVLSSVAEVLIEFDKNLIEIVGYTDSSGGDRINLPLSNQRAKNVAQYLQYQGVSGSRVTSWGAGAQRPIADNQTKEGRAQNRRVEITLKPAPRQP